MMNHFKTYKFQFIKYINKLLGNKTYWNLESAYKTLNLQCPSLYYVEQYNEYRKILPNIINISGVGVINSYIDYDRQTGKSILNIIQALIASQHSKVVIVAQNNNTASYFKKCFYEYARKLSISIDNLVGVISYKDFLSHKNLHSIHFCVPFIDSICYTHPLKINE